MQKETDTFCLERYTGIRLFRYKKKQKNSTNGKKRDSLVSTSKKKSDNTRPTDNSTSATDEKPWIETQGKLLHFGGHVLAVVMAIESASSPKRAVTMWANEGFFCLVRREMILKVGFFAKFLSTIAAHISALRVLFGVRSVIADVFVRLTAARVGTSEAAIR